jgi:phosphate-selective porin OprO and OprP
MKRSPMIAAALIGILAAQPAHADEAAMMRQLEAMQAQMNAMQKEMNRLQTELAQTRSQTAAIKKTADEAKAAKAAKPEGGVKISMVPAPKFETADGAYSFKVGGFGQIDAGMFSDDMRDYPDGTNVRRARLNASGTIARDFNYKIENDFAGNASALTDIYLEYTGFKPVSLMVGQFKEPFGLETLTSDLFTTFMERASPSIFSPDRQIGAQVSTYGTSTLGAWSVAAGGFGSGTGVASTDDEARDITGRVTLAPFAEGTKVLHLGIAGSHRIPLAATDSMRFSSRPETNLPPSSLVAVDTGTIDDVENTQLLGLEAAGVYGPFSLQGEYVRADVNREAMSDAQFNGYYAEASYFLTGESRNYSAKSGKFDRVKPHWPLNIKEGNWGAWQVAARVSNLDLNDGAIAGGEMKNLTLGLRWIPHANVAITGNYIKIDTDASAEVPNDSPSVWMLRTQVDF